MIDFHELLEGLFCPIHGIVPRMYNVMGGPALVGLVVVAAYKVKEVLGKCRWE